MNKNTAGVLFAVMALITGGAWWINDNWGPDAIATIADRFSLLIVFVAGIIVALITMRIVLNFVVDFQAADDRGEIERIRSFREEMKVMREDVRGNYQLLKQQPAQLSTPDPPRLTAQSWRVDNNNDDSNNVDLSEFMILE